MKPTVLVALVGAMLAVGTIEQAGAGTLDGTSCMRHAGVPYRTVEYFTGTETVSGSGALHRCPSHVTVQVVTCLQFLHRGSFADVSCKTSALRTIRPSTRGLRGAAATAEAACATGVWRTRVTRIGKGLPALKWFSARSQIQCTPPEDDDS